ncbi:MAG: flavoredoxin [Isosphaerales bacterium]
MEPLPDAALVVRGGQNLPENFVKGSGVTVGGDESLQGVSVNSAPGLTVKELTGAISQTGYPGILNNQVGVTTVGAVRECGGNIVSSPTRTNPNHSTLSGLTPEQASRLFRPTVLNHNRHKKK